MTTRLSCHYFPPPPQQSPAIAPITASWNETILQSLNVYHVSKIVPILLKINLYAFYAFSDYLTFILLVFPNFLKPYTRSVFKTNDGVRGSCIGPN